jgi:transposase-like protein
MEQVNQNASCVRQRIVRSEEQILSQLEEFEKGGFTIKEFCELIDIHETTFYSWLRKYRKDGSNDGNGFATIEVVASESRPELFAEVGNIRLYKQVPVEYLKALVS